MNVLLSTTYFGPVQWYQKLYRADEAQIEQHESFLKQTYHNRCLIATTNGIQALTVPVVKGEAAESGTVRAMRISDHGNWRHLHWYALQSAYGESPFFEYYQDDIRHFFEQRWDYLFDFNQAICQKMCELLDIHPTLTLTTHYISPSALHLPSSTGYTDFRDSIRPKKPAPDPDFTPRRYYQVYEQKHGFLPNLSILDLLFNMGPESIFFL